MSMTLVPFSVIEATTPRLSFAEDLALYAAIGADGIGIQEQKLGAKDDLARFRDSGLRTSSCFLNVGSILPTPWLPGPADPAERLDALSESIRRLAPYEPDSCFIVSGPCGRYEPAEAHTIVVEGVRRLASGPPAAAK